jgi:hypothetical protein
MPDLHQIREQIREQIAGLEPPNAPGSDYAYISGFVAGYGEARRDALAIIDAAIEHESAKPKESPMQRAQRLYAESIAATHQALGGNYGVSLNTSLTDRVTESMKGSE